MAPVCTLKSIRFVGGNDCLQMVADETAMDDVPNQLNDDLEAGQWTLASSDACASEFVLLRSARFLPRFVDKMVHLCSGGRRRTYRVKCREINSFHSLFDKTYVGILQS